MTRIFDNRNDKALRLEGHLACAIYIAKCLFCFVKYDGWLVWASLLFVDMHFSILGVGHAFTLYNGESVVRYC